MARKREFSFKAGDILKDVSIVDSYNHPFLMIWEWSSDTTGQQTAEVINVLARRGWILHMMTSSRGGGMSGNQVVIHSVYRKQRKRKDDTP